MTDPFPIPPAPLEGAALQAGRNTLDQQSINQIRLSGQPLDLVPRELLPRLRFRDPTFPTDIETALITTMRAAFPEMAADFRSYQNKPTGCGCAGKLMQAMMKAPEKTQAALDHVYGSSIYKFVPVNPTSQLPTQGRAAPTMIGHTATIDATPAAWTAYFEGLIKSKGFANPASLKQQYSGVHVRDIEDGKKWLLLFY